MRHLLIALLCLASIVNLARAQERTLDGFESLDGWSVITADGVGLKTSLEPGRDGRSLRLDYDFTRGSGYGIIRKQFSLPLPENYRFKYAMRGEGPDNTVEFKMIDSSGDNVWWVNQRNLHFPREWKTVTLKHRHFSFAWGPAGASAPFPEMRFLEIAITSTTGGRGTVWLDDLTFESLSAPRPYTATPRLRASSGSIGAGDELPASGILEWSSGTDDHEPFLEVDFGERREFGGVVLEWQQEDYAREYTVSASDDGTTWLPLANIREGNGSRDYLWLPESDARLIRVAITSTGRGRGASLRSLEVKSLNFGASRNDFFEAIAKDSPSGRYPKYFLGRASYWTVIGVDGDQDEALINEEGMIETNRGAFSIEPFLYADSRLFTWADAKILQGLQDEYLPIPWVRWSLPGLALETKAFADGGTDNPVLWVRYEVRNESDSLREGTLFLAVRPFQVLPPYQNLNITGGAARIDRVRAEQDCVRINESAVLAPITPPRSIGATAFQSGDVTEYLSSGTLPSSTGVDDSEGLASAALAYPFSLTPRESQVIWLASPFRGRVPPSLPRNTLAAESRLDAAAADWKAKLGLAALSLPRSATPLWNIARSTLAYVLINRDGPAIQPGSRNYERTWIRDGSLTSAALHAFGHSGDVRTFLDWFAPNQYDNGKIPCCVDRRGPDPVPEHDSHGQYIFAVLNHFQFNDDKLFLEQHWPRVRAAANYIETLRNERMTDEYRLGAPDAQAKYGLLPESISHEGYSAKPMHSYWDDLFALKGLKDAVTIAETLGHTDDASRLAALRDAFRETLVASLRRVTAQKEIDYMPGCAELGDFDATSTTVALFPCGEMGHLPEPLLRNTFDRYWAFCQDRQSNGAWDAYTPYETRAIGAFVRLGWRERAHELLDFFLEHQRPQGWNHWAEVVWRDTAKPSFIGDMPHTWVGSDFLNSFRSFFVYERESDGALVLLAGVPEGWMRSSEGVALTRWPTHYGLLSYRVAPIDGQTAVIIDAGPSIPAAGILVQPPTPSKIMKVLVDGSPASLTAQNEVVLRALPATIRFEYSD